MKVCILVLGLVAATGCNRQIQQKGKAPDAREPFPVRISGVHFDGDEALECVEMTATVDEAFLLKRSPADRVKAERLIVDGLTDRIKSNGAVVPIDQPCGKQFGGRPLFANCALPPSTDGPLTISLDSYFLSFDFAFANDHNMKDCISAKGQWKEMPRTSPEFIQAKLHHDEQKMERLMGRSVKQLEGIQ